MRKRYSRITWKIKHVRICFFDAQSQLVASTRNSLSKDDFLDELVDFLVQDGYSPRLPVEVMRKRMHNPYSESESYIFLKTDEDGRRLKLVLDIRWSTHPLNEYGNYTGAQRKIHHLDTKVIPEIASEGLLDVSDAKSKFIDVQETGGTWLTVMSVDSQLCTNYQEALNLIEHTVKGFDEEVAS